MRSSLPKGMTTSRGSKCSCAVFNMVCVCFSLRLSISPAISLRWYSITLSWCCGLSLTCIKKLRLALSSYNLSFVVAPATHTGPSTCSILGSNSPVLMFFSVLYLLIDWLLIISRRESSALNAPSRSSINNIMYFQKSFNE